MGYYLIESTTVSEFVAAMERVHIPQKIVIPLSVVFRFFPTIREEYAAIGDAMKMRGISTLRSPIKMLEYRVVPLMISIANIGEELSAAALTRGLVRLLNGRIFVISLRCIGCYICGCFISLLDWVRYMKRRT